MPKLLAFSILTLLYAPPALAERAPQSKETMRKNATDVVVARIARIYTRTEEGGGWRATHFVAEIVVEKSEKGAAKKGDLLYARYWQQRWIGKGPPPPSASGHFDVPKEGETVRIYAVRKGHNGFRRTTDGGLDVYGPNGFERIPKTK